MSLLSLTGDSGVTGLDSHAGLRGLVFRTDSGLSAMLLSSDSPSDRCSPVKLLG